MPLRLFIAAVFCASLLNAGCAEDDAPDTQPDAGSDDAAVDAVGDAGGDDVGPDVTDEDADPGDASEDAAGPDVGVDVRPDATADAAPDTVADTTVDTMPDAAADADGDTAADAGADTSTDVATDTSPDASPDVRPDAALDTALDTMPDAAADTGADVLADTGGGYPAGPYGVLVGDTIDNLAFVASDGSAVDLDELRAGARLIVLATAASWCPTCRANAPRLDTLQDTWRDDGVVVVTVLYENASFLPASAADAAAWVSDLGLDHTVVADGPFVVAPYLEPAGREMHVIVDARDMTIARVQRSLNVADIDAWISGELTGE